MEYFASRFASSAGVSVSSTLHARRIARQALVIEIEVLGQAFGAEAFVVITFITVLHLASGTGACSGLEHTKYAFGTFTGARAFSTAVGAFLALSGVARSNNPLVLALVALGLVTSAVHTVDN